MQAANLALTLIAVIAAIGILIFGVRNLRALSARLSDLIDEVRRLEAAVIAALQGGSDEDPRDLRLESSAQSLPNLWPVWRRFSATLVRPGGGARVASTQPVGNYFNGDIAYRSSIDLRSYESIPNRLIGAGLLVTFFCLAFSILFARAGIGGDLNATLETIRNLLGTASVKFVSSIAAIGMSLYFSHRKDQLLRALDAALERLCAAIEESLVPVSGDTLAEATLEQLQLQTELLEQGNDALASTIATQLDETLRANLAGALKPIADEIGGLGARMGEMNQRALEYMVDRFSTALGEAAKAHTQEMTALLNEVSSSLTGLPTQLNTASSAFVAVIDDVTAQFKGGVQDSSTAIGEMATEIRSLTSEIRLSEQALAGHLSQAEKRVGTTIDHFGTLVEALEDAASTLQPLNEAGRQLGEGGATLLAGANELKAVAAQNSLSSERLAEAVESYKAGLAGLDEMLGATFARIEAGLQKLDSRAEGAASVINADLGTELARLAEAVLTLQMVVKHRRVTEAAE